MKLILEKTDLGDDINIIKKNKPWLDNTWHYHKQYELLYVSKSSGIRFVGDNVSHFNAKDLVLVGSFLPHIWRTDSHFQKKNTDKVKIIVSKFNKEFIGKDTFDNPKFSQIKKMLDKSKYGISFGKNVSEKLHNEFNDLVELTEIEQCIKLLDILHQLSISCEARLLSSTDMTQKASKNASKLDAIFKYVAENYKHNITLKEIAGVACLAPNSFCRYFKSKTNKSFIQFLNEVRIKQTCRLLAQENINISEACFLVGYNSITNFNKQFKLIVGCTPQNYKKLVFSK